MRSIIAVSFARAIAPRIIIVLLGICKGGAIALSFDSSDRTSYNHRIEMMEMDKIVSKKDVG